jgi:hypothetical protein
MVRAGRDGRAPWVRACCVPRGVSTRAWRSATVAVWVVVARPSRYILVYPHGCDVCNHLSLFLCVADYDKLLPGAQAGGRAGGRWFLRALLLRVARRLGSCCCAWRWRAQAGSMQAGVLCQAFGAVPYAKAHKSCTAAVRVCACRLEPLCPVHGCSRQQGPQEEQVLGCVCSGRGA